MSWLTSPWLTIRVQIGLGAIFLVAALPKIADPPSFAHMIYNYRLVPGALVNAMALVMPWVEILAGLALILGVWRREAAAVSRPADPPLPRRDRAQPRPGPRRGLRLLRRPRRGQDPRGAILRHAVGAGAGRGILLLVVQVLLAGSVQSPRSKVQSQTL